MNAQVPALIASIVAASAVAASAGDWPQWRGPNRDGISAEKIGTHWPDDGPKLLWRAEVGTGFSSITVSQGRAYTLGNSTNEDSIWCFDDQTGQSLWQHSYPAQLSPQWYEGGPGATPTVDAQHVFTISKWGDVFCLDALSGAILWNRDLRQDQIKPNRWGFAGSPLLWHELVILNAGGGGTALDRRTGRIVWSNGTNATGYASPVLFRALDTECVLIFAAQHLVALDPATGRELWRHPWKTDWDTNNSDPIVFHDSVFISSFSHGCALLSLENGKPRPLYDTKAVFNNLSPGVLLGDYLYVFSGEAKKDTELRCLHLPTGQLNWTRKDPAFGSLLATDGHLLVLTDKGELQVFAKDTAGRETGSAHGPIPNANPIARAKVLTGTCWTPPALANGRLYVRNAKGELRCLDLGPTH